MKFLSLSYMAIVSFIVLSACNSPANETTKTPAAETVENNIVVPDMHTSESSLDWEGTYKGTLPCADCEGIETTIVLKKDGNFERTAVYKGKEDGNFQDAGTFSWDKDGRIITLEVKNENPSYQVREGNIVMLNPDREVNTGELAEFYVLKKQ